MLAEDLVLMLCFVSVCQLLHYLRYFPPPLIPETLSGLETSPLFSCTSFEPLSILDVVFYFNQMGTI